MLKCLNVMTFNSQHLHMYIAHDDLRLGLKGPFSSFRLLIVRSPAQPMKTAVFRGCGGAESGLRWEANLKQEVLHHKLGNVHIGFRVSGASPILGSKSQDPNFMEISLKLPLEGIV